jgi:hypothetical protein
MSNNVKSPFDKEPAEGSRDVVERELKRQDEASKSGDHMPGVKVSGQPQGGAADRASKDRTDDAE